jgi:hypothetical protein
MKQRSLERIVTLIRPVPLEYAPPVSFGTKGRVSSVIRTRTVLERANPLLVNIPQPSASRHPMLVRTYSQGVPSGSKASQLMREVIPFGITVHLEPSGFPVLQWARVLSWTRCGVGI